MKFKSLLSFLLFLLSSAVFAVETVTVDDGEYKGWVFIKNGDGTYSLISIPGVRARGRCPYYPGQD